MTDNIMIRSNGSPAGDAFVRLWRSIELADRERARVRRQRLRELGIKGIVPNDGWVKREAGVPVSIPYDHPYGEYDSLAVGDRIALGYVEDERAEMVDVYQVIRLHDNPIFKRADIEWLRAVKW